MKAWIFASVGLRSVGYKLSGIETCMVMLSTGNMAVEYSQKVKRRPPTTQAWVQSLVILRKVRRTKLRCQDFAQSSRRFPCDLSFCQYVKFISQLLCVAMRSTSNKNVKVAPPPRPPTVLCALFD